MTLPVYTNFIFVTSVMFGYHSNEAASWLAYEFAPHHNATIADSVHKSHGLISLDFE